MGTWFNIVRGEALDFDDIYEGTKLESIGELKEFMSIFANRYAVIEWLEVKSGVWEGMSMTSNATFELSGNEKHFSWLIIKGLDEGEVAAFCEEYKLNILL